MSAMESHAPTEIVIPLSRGKFVLYFFVAVAFVLGSVWVWSIADAQTLHDPLYMKAVAIAGVSFFGLCAIFYCLKMFDTRPGLIIDDQGIVDNSRFGASGRIYWDDVVDLKVFEIKRQRFITIFVADPHKYAARGNILARILTALNTKLTGSPINISSNVLQMNFDNLLGVLNEAFEKSRQKGK